MLSYSNNLDVLTLGAYFIIFATWLDFAPRLRQNAHIKNTAGLAFWLGESKAEVTMHQP